MLEDHSFSNIFIAYVEDQSFSNVFMAYGNGTSVKQINELKFSGNVQKIKNCFLV